MIAVMVPAVLSILLMVPDVDEVFTQDTDFNDLHGHRFPSGQSQGHSGETHVEQHLSKAVPVSLFATPKWTPPELTRLSNSEIEQLIVGSALATSHPAFAGERGVGSFAKFFPGGIYRKRLRDNRFPGEIQAKYVVYRDAIILDNYTRDGRGGCVMLFFRGADGSLSFLRSQSLDAGFPQDALPVPFELESL